MILKLSIGTEQNPRPRSDSLSGFSFGYTDDGKPGYREDGADTVSPFKTQADIDSAYSAGFDAGKNNVIYLGTGTSFNVSSYAGYENFTADNFIVGISSCESTGFIYTWTSSNDEGIYHYFSGLSFSKNYSPSSGKLSITKNNGEFWSSCRPNLSNPGKGVSNITPVFFAYLIVAN